MSGATRRSRRGGAHCKRNQRQKGGGTQSYGFGADVTPAHAGYAQVLTQEPSAVLRPGMASGSYGPLPGMRGGRYMVDPGTPLFPGSDAAVRMSIPCEASRSAVPMRGGSASVTMNPMLLEPTAGYAFGADSSKTAIGTPIQIQVPYEAKGMNPACVKTGGKRITRRNTAARRNARKAGRKGRKGRKTARRSHCSRRSHSSRRSHCSRRSHSSRHNRRN